MYTRCNSLRILRKQFAIKYSWLRINNILKVITVRPHAPF